MNKPQILLFLDFDNVMHWCGKELPFTRMTELEAIIDLHPELRIVISSSWRESFDLVEIKEFFSSKVRDRIIDMTPVIEPELVADEDGELRAMEQGLREQEIEFFLQTKHWEDLPWIALDDALDLFHNPEKLILVEKGIDAQTIAQVEHWLNTIQGKPVMSLPSPSR